MKIIIFYNVKPQYATKRDTLVLCHGYQFLSTCMYWYLIGMLYSREDPARASTFCSSPRFVQTDPDPQCILPGSRVSGRRPPWNNVGSPGRNDRDTCQAGTEVSLCWYESAYSC